MVFSQWLHGRSIGGPRGPDGAASKTPLPGPRRLALAVWTHRWFWLAVLVALGVGGWEAGRAFIGPAVVVDVVKRGQIVETLVASGNVETPYRVDIGSQITGTVSDVLVEEGQTVATGQRLIVLEDKELRGALVQAKGAVGAGDVDAGAGGSRQRAKDI